MFSRLGRGRRRRRRFLQGLRSPDPELRLVSLVRTVASHRPSPIDLGRALSRTVTGVVAEGTSTRRGWMRRPPSRPPLSPSAIGSDLEPLSDRNKETDDNLRCGTRPNGRDAGRHERASNATDPTDGRASGTGDDGRRGIDRGENTIPRHARRSSGPFPACRGHPCPASASATSTDHPQIATLAVEPIQMQIRTVARRPRKLHARLPKGHT